MFSNRAIELVKEIYKTQHTLPTYDVNYIKGNKILFFFRMKLLEK